MSILAHELGEGRRGIDLLVRQIQEQNQLEDVEGRRLQHACEAKKVVSFRHSGLSKQAEGRLKALGD